MAYIIYPTIDLFLYDLRDGLGQNQPTIKQNRQHFAQKLPETLQNSLFQYDTDFEAEFVELLGEQQTEPLPLKSQHYEGYYYPVRLGDTYGLLLDCSVADETYPYPVQSLAYIKTIIEQTLKNQATLGQTWMISGQLATDPYPAATPETLARECYKALTFPDSNWEKDYRDQYHFQGVTLFELGQNRLAIEENQPADYPLPSTHAIQKNHHVIIAIYTDSDTARKTADLIADWMHLFCYRHKILRAYAHSRQLKLLLKGYFTKIQQYLLQETDRTNQKTIDEASKTFSKYAITLDYFYYQVRTIEINLHNYKQRLATIIAKIQPNNTQNQLNFLEKFAGEAQDKYLLQVQKDYDNLTPGLRLLDVFRAEVAVIQGKRDRTFQNTVAIWGIGIAVGSAVATISSQFPTASDITTEDAVNNPVGETLSKYLQIPDPWLAPSITIVFSLVAAFIAGGITKGIIGLRQRSP